MRSADYVLSTIEGHSPYGDIFTDRGSIYYENDVIRLINEIRKETIRECAERAKVVDDKVGGIYAMKKTPVDKESILSLINELQ